MFETVVSAMAIPRTIALMNPKIREAKVPIAMEALDRAASALVGKVSWMRGIAPVGGAADATAKLDGGTVGFGGIRT